MELGLSERALFDAVGNHFDPDALIVCLLGPLEAWAGGARHRHEFPAPRQLLSGFRQLRRWVDEQTDEGRVQCPFPDDLRDQLETASAREEASLTAGGGREV